MIGDLPEDWKETTLGEVCSKPQYGWTCKATAKGKVKYVRTSDISGKQFSWGKVPYCASEPDDLAKYRVEIDDILVSRAGSVGISHRVREVPCDAVFASYLIRFRALENVLPEWIEHYLKSGAYWRSISEISAGIALQNVNASKLSALELPLPPLPEQRRIVAKLKDLLGKLDDCQSHLARIPTILKRFRQSVLAAACSGRLTEDWRDIQQFEPKGDEESPDDLPTGWKRTRVGDLLDSICYGTAKKCGYDKKGVPILRIPNVAGGKIDRTDMKYAELTKRELEQLRIRDGDLLMIRSNGSVSLVGRCAIVTATDVGTCFAGYLLRLRPLTHLVEPKYLGMALDVYETRLQIEQEARSTSGVNNINTDEVRSLAINLPPLSEQKEIVGRVEKLFALSDLVESRYKSAKAEADYLTPSVLARAFRGELVPIGTEPQKTVKASHQRV